MYGNGLELDLAIETHAFFNINSNDHIKKHS
jgi:hypothetical protein